MFQNRPRPFGSEDFAAKRSQLQSLVYKSADLSKRRACEMPLRLPTNQLVNRSTSQLIKPGCWTEAFMLQVVYMRGRTRPPHAATARHNSPHSVRHPGPGLHLNQNKIQKIVKKQKITKLNRKTSIQIKVNQQTSME